MTKVKGSLSVIDSIEFSRIYFQEEHSGNASQTLTSGTAVDITNSSASVDFPDNIEKVLAIMSVKNQASGAADVANMILRINTTDYGFAEMVSLNGLATKTTATRIIDVSAFAGTTQTVKLRGNRIFNDISITNVEWQLLAV